MIFLRGLVRTIDNRINPIAVKELRQAVRSGLVTGGFVLFVSVLLLAMGTVLIDQDESTMNFLQGRAVFGYLIATLMVAATFLLPVHTGARLAGEREDSGADLLFTTALSTGRIIRGKMLAAVLLAVIVYSACGPFLTFTYLLRGIDFPTIVLALAVCFMFSVTAIQFALLVGALPAGRSIRILIVLACIPVGYAVIVRVYDALNSSTPFIREIMSIFSVRGEAWPVLGTLLVLDALAMGLFYVLAVALLIPPAANRTLNVRLYLMFAWLVMGAIALAWMLEVNNPAPLIAWGFAWWGFLLLSSVVAVSERESWGPRIRRTIPKNRLLRPGAFVLYTGSGGGVTWIMLMIALTAGAVKLAQAVWPKCGLGSLVGWPEDNQATHIMVGLSLFTYAYCMTAVLLRRHVFKRLAVNHTGLLAVAVLCAGCLGPTILGYIFLSSEYGSRLSHKLYNEPGWWNVTSPFTLLQYKCRNACLLTAGIWSLIVGVLSAPWYASQIARFKPMARPVEPARDTLGPADLVIPVAIECEENIAPPPLPTIVNTDDDAVQ